MHMNLVVRETAVEASAAISTGRSRHYRRISQRRARNIGTYDEVYRSLGELRLRRVGSVAGSQWVHGRADEVADWE